MTDAAVLHRAALILRNRGEKPDGVVLTGHRTNQIILLNIIVRCLLDTADRMNREAAS